MRAKRTVDIIVSAAMLFLLSPLLLVISVLIALDSGLPVIFRHRRVGKHFRDFDLLKFRTMKHLCEGPQVTVSGDARITRIGKWLRVAKLDELPQLWNVLHGEMSLVGPRPEVPEYVDLFRNRYQRILRVRPGITDLASIRFRHEQAILAQAADPLQEYKNVILPAKLALAEEYLDAWSPTLDLRIVWQTVVAILAK